MLALSALSSDLSRLPSVYGDSRLGSERGWTVTNAMFNVAIPAGQHQALTVCGWFRMRYASGLDLYLTTAAFYCPEAIQRSNPDLLGGAGGYPSDGGWQTAAGTNLTSLGGAVTVADFSWQPYADQKTSNQWPRGVYTVAGWSSNAVTVSLGGADVTLGPGAFNRNMVPGPSTSCVISGDGLICIGISRTPDAEFFENIDGVADVSTTMLTADSIVTNEISFAAWRFTFVDGTNLVYRSDLTRIDNAQCMGQTTTNPTPRTARAFDSRGSYKIGFMGLGSGFTPLEVEAFDVRCFAWRLTDDELCRIHSDGVLEIARRKIPQWK